MASPQAVANAANTDLSWLPSDADEQLSLSFRIISNAYRTRVNSFEAELRSSRTQLTQKAEQMAALQKKTSALELQLIENSQRANQLSEENKQLVASVQKLQKDNSRLESLKKAVLNSIQEDHPIEDVARSKLIAEDILQKSAPRTLQEMSAPDFGSDYFSMSFCSAASPYDRPEKSGTNLDFDPSRTSNAPQGKQIDGKAFFKSAREILTNEQFNIFLGNIKKLNHHAISREEALRHAQLIFAQAGPGGESLYSDFKNMLTRHV